MHAETLQSLGMPTLAVSKWFSEVFPARFMLTLWQRVLNSLTSLQLSAPKTLGNTCTGGLESGSAFVAAPLIAAVM